VFPLLRRRLGPAGRFVSQARRAVWLARRLPEADQQSVARAVAGWLEHVEDEVGRQPPAPCREVDDVLRTLALASTARRMAAMRAGPDDERAPDMIAATLAEAWTAALMGQFGEQAFRVVDVEVRELVASSRRPS